MKQFAFISAFVPFLALICVPFVSGCGCSGKSRSDRASVYPVSGRVLLDGEPVVGATLAFQPLNDEGKPGIAVTDNGGYFNAQTFEKGDGLIAGRYRVSIRKTHLVDRNGNIVQMVMDDGGGLVEKNFVPARYAEFATSDIEVEVEAKRINRLDPFELSETAGSGR
jgi:hypothetical protein